MQRNGETATFMFIEGATLANKVRAADYSGDRETDGIRSVCELTLSADAGLKLSLYIRSADNGRDFRSLPEFLEYADEALESYHWAAIAAVVPGACYDAESGELTLPFIKDEESGPVVRMRSFLPEDDSPLILMMTEARILVLMD